MKQKKFRTFSNLADRKVSMELLKGLYEAEAKDDKQADNTNREAGTPSVSGLGSVSAPNQGVDDTQRE